MQITVSESDFAICKWKKSWVWRILYEQTSTNFSGSPQRFGSYVWLLSEYPPAYLEIALKAMFYHVLKEFLATDLNNDGFLNLYKQWWDQ